MGFGLTISPFLMMTKHMELSQIIWEETSSEAPLKHMQYQNQNVTYKLDVSIKVYE